MVVAVAIRVVQRPKEIKVDRYFFLDQEVHSKISPIKCNVVFTVTLMVCYVLHIQAVRKVDFTIKKRGKPKIGEECKGKLFCVDSASEIGR